MNDSVDYNTQVPAPSPDVAELNKRRAVIKSLYQEILGRDADINGLSYYTVHKEIGEDEIRKQMCQSTDHRDLIIRAQKFPEVEKKCIALEDQVLKLQNEIVQKDSLITNLRAVTSAPTQTQYNNNYAEDMIHSEDKISAPIAGISVSELKYPKSKGCIGILKSFFGV